MISVKLKPSNRIGIIYEFEYISDKKKHVLTGNITKNKQINVKVTCNAKRTPWSFLLSGIYLQPSLIDGIEYTFKTRRHEHYFRGVIKNGYIEFELTCYCNNSSKKEIDIEKLKSFDLVILNSVPIHGFTCFGNSNDDFTGEYKIGVNDVQIRKQLKFIDVGMPVGKFKIDNEVYNSYDNTMLTLDNDTKTYVVTLTFGSVNSIGGYCYKYKEDEQFLKTDLSNIIKWVNSDNDIGIYKKINRLTRNSCIVAVGWVMYIYENSIKIKLILYDFAKAFEYHKKILTYGKNPGEKNYDIIWLDSDGALNNKTNSLHIEDLIKDINCVGLKYIYVDEPFNLTYIADNYMLHDYINNIHLNLTLTDENGRSLEIFNVNLLKNVKFSQLGNQTFEKYFEEVKNHYYNSITPEIFKENPDGFSPDFNGTLKLNSEVTDDKPYFLTMVAPALLEYADYRLYTKGTNTPKYDDYMQDYFTAHSSITKTNYKDSFIYNHLNGKRLTTVNYYLLTTQALVENTYKPTYITTNPDSCKTIPIEFDIKLSPLQKKVVHAWMSKNINEEPDQ